MGESSRGDLNGSTDDAKNFVQTVQKNPTKKPSKEPANQSKNASYAGSNKLNLNTETKKNFGNLSELGRRALDDKIQDDSFSFDINHDKSILSDNNSSTQFELTREDTIL